MKIKVLCLILMAGFMVSCADTEGLKYRKMNSEDISPSYLASLESNGKTLLTVDNATSNSVRLIMTTEASQYISIVCDPGETCYFEYTRDVATVTNYLSVDNGEYNAYNWNGSCIVETINQLEQCNVSEGTLLHVAVSEF